MRTTLLFLCAHSFFQLVKADGSSSCHYPGSPQHGKLSSWAPSFSNASIARFECYPGYELVGPQSLECLNGKWSRGIPFCERDLARGKPARQSEPLTEDSDTGFLVDGNDTTCTKPAKQWSVNLFERTKITSVKLVFGAESSDSAVSILIGDEFGSGNESFTGHRCAQQNLDIESQQPYFFKCEPKTTPGSYISVRIEAKTGPVPLCVLEAHSSSALSHEDACPQGYNSTFKDAFNGTCYEFHYLDPAPIGDARSICYRAGGHLVGSTHMDLRTLDYLKWRSEEIFKGSSFWLNLNSTALEALRNNSGSDINAGKGECYVLSSKNGFSRSECKSPNHVVCAYSVVSCGRPRLPKALVGWLEIDKLRTGRSLKNLRCADGFYAEMDEPLACDMKGEISGAVRCQEFACGMPPVVVEGVSRATSNHTAEYKCSKGKFLKGDSLVVCDVASRRWSEAPACKAFFEAFSDWFQDSTNSFHRIGELPMGGQVAIIAGLAAVAVVVLFGIFYRFHIVRQRRGIKGALRLESQPGLPAVSDPELSLH